MLSRIVPAICGAAPRIQGQGQKGFYFMQISKAVQNPTNCLFINFSSYYFWRKSNQNVGVDTPAE